LEAPFYGRLGGRSAVCFDITFTDPVTFIGMMIVLAAVALLAGYVPSLRVSRINPIKALRTS
jgi:putative ABC transport system permease protein